MRLGDTPKRYAPDAMEQAVIQHWRDHGTFRRQVEAGRAAYEADPSRRFVFLEGPPTANGLPHPGHVLTRTLKDSVCRYHAMQGKWVPRKAGWDCHGLPVEIEVQKELGIEHVSEIDAYGVEPFLQKCRQSVFRYKGEWEAMSERVGFWVDYDDPYVTMDDEYIESVWWSLKRLFDQGLLVRSYKVVPYCPLTGTSYSSHEVAQGYKDVEDTACFVKFHLVDDPDGARVLSWTTTPWTLPGNVALAVGPDIEYAKVRVLEASPLAAAAPGEVLVVGKALLKSALRNKVELIEQMPGSALVGRSYEPLFPGAVDATGSQVAFQVVPADFVTTEDGTGVVHTAVMYGEDDYQLGMEIGLPAQHTVGLDGLFVQRVPGGLAGRYVKDPETEQAILEYLRGRDMLYRQEAYQHSYPHCWRTGHPLLYYAMESWYVRMSALRDALLENNDAVGWVPESIKDGRMGDWLRNVKDWAFSRSRYWGTPLPVWECTSCGHMTCIGSRKELSRHGLTVHDLHRPHVDRPIACPACGGQAKREPYVIDVWYDSGAAQFAQWHATSLDDDALHQHWPVDFIAEGLDQTRGWFYSLLAASTALGDAADAKAAGLFQGPPYRNCLVNGLILAEDGQKMSKSKRNYVSPDEVFRKHGADATRWYLLSATAPWQDKRFFDEAVRDTYGRFFGTLWNTFLFWKQYAALDDWRPQLSTLDRLGRSSQAPALDRWLLSRLEATIDACTQEADRFHLHKATRAIEDFVVDDLSNWWVRRSRERFWSESGSSDKQSAHATLWWALHSVCRLVAPWAPFMVEHIWQHVRLEEDGPSVHLAPFPQAGARDDELEAKMTRVRALAEAGRALRSRIGIPSRHPLARAVVVGDVAGLEDTLRDELNVKQLDQAADLHEARAWVAQPERAALGPAFKRLAPLVAAAIEALDGDEAHAALAAGRTVGVHVEGDEHPLTAKHIAFAQEDRQGWATAEAGTAAIALYCVRDEALMAEGFVREVVRRVQELRKELDLDIDATIDLTLAAPDQAAQRLERFRDMLATEVRASRLELAPVGSPLRVWDIDGQSVAAAVAGHRRLPAQAA